MSSEDKSREPAPEGAQKLPEDSASKASQVNDRAPSPESPSESNSEAPADKSAQPSPSRPAGGTDAPTDAEAPPLPNEPIPGTEGEPSADNAPPLPSEPVPEPEDDGWECHWNPNTSSYWFYNRFTSVWQEENPRVPGATSSAPAPTVSVPETQDRSTISDPISVAGGYNPAIHGDYDENAWYAKNARAVTEPSTSVAVPSADAAAGYEYTSGGYFNVRTGQWQSPDQGVERHTDEAKSRRQMNAFFDVDAAANMHDGRSLKAERAGKKPSKAELKMFKEKRRAKKEEKRRAWLRD